MTQTVFYSWQSDLPNNTNRSFIEDAIKKAIRNVSQDAEVEEAMRDGKLAFDKDTQGVSGTPPIVDVILNKISACTIFVPDLTFVTTTQKGRGLPNPNVLIEYGWALNSVGHACTVPVMNVAFGVPDEKSMPFNMRHMRHPITYNLPARARQPRRDAEKTALVKALAAQFKIILGQLVDEETVPIVPFQAVPFTDHPAVFFKSGETLATWNRFEAEHKCTMATSGPKMFLRVIPTAATSPIDKVEASGLVQRDLWPLSYTQLSGYLPSGRNRYGAMIYREDNDNIMAFSQLHTNQEIWGVSSEPADWYTPQGPIFANGYEAAFIRALSNYLGFAKNTLGLPPPLKFIVGFANVEGFRMAPTGVGAFNLYGSDAVLDQHIVETGQITDYETEPLELLRPFFERVWRECGVSERPDVIN